MSRFYTDCDECNECVAFCSLGNISCPCEHGSCPNEEEIEDDFCEWKTDSWGLFPIKTSCENSLDINYGYKFCSYCGKKIKVIE